MNERTGPEPRGIGPDPTVVRPPGTAGPDGAAERPTVDATQEPNPAGEPDPSAPDDARVAADAAMLDAVAAGGVPPDADTLTAMLASWRTDLDTDLDGVDGGGALPPLRTAIPGRTVTAYPRASGDLRDRQGRTSTRGTDPASATRTDPAPADRTDPAPATRLPRRPARAEARSRRLPATLAAIAVALAGLGAGTATATPRSPLWTLSRMVNPDRAAVIEAREGLHAARTAISEHRYLDASTWLDRAERAIARIRDAGDARPLRAELQQLRSELDRQSAPSTRGTAPSPETLPGGPPTGTTTPVPPGTPAGPAPEPAQPTRGAPAPGPQPSDPPLPLPTIPGILPLPSPTLSGLPLPTSDLPGR